MSSIATFQILCFCLFCGVNAKIFGRCELAHAMINYGFPEDQIATWICTVEFESAYNTSAVNAGGDHGLFQINQRWWCSNTSTPGGSCHIPCSKLEDDDIDDDVACVKIIFNQRKRIYGNGFLAWVAYKRHCTGDVSSYIERCDLNLKKNDKDTLPSGMIKLISIVR